jgi:hypothetical protein
LKSKKSLYPEVRKSSENSSKPEKLFKIIPDRDPPPSTIYKQRKKKNNVVKTYCDDFVWYKPSECECPEYECESDYEPRTCSRVMVSESNA